MSKQSGNNPPPPARRVLMVDAGVAFGGALFVSARLAGGLDKARYVPVIVAAMEEDTVAFHTPAGVKAYSLKMPFNYVDRARLTIRLRRWPRALFKPGIYLASLYEAVVNARYLISLIRIIIRERIDLVHVNNSLWAVAAAKLARRRVLWHFHGFWGEGSRLSHALLNRCDAGIAISHVVKDDVVTNPALHLPVTVVHNPIAPTREITESVLLKVRRQYGIVEGRLVIGIFGRLVDWKGQLEFLQAVEHLNRLSVDFSVLVVGDGAEGFGRHAEKLRQYAEQKLPPGRVIFTGFVVDVAPLYGLCDIVVHASTSPEPFGLVITEAMQYRSAIIASSLGAGPELVTDGLDGLIADPHDSEQLADKIKLLLTDGALRDRLIEAGYKKVMGSLTPEKVAAEVACVYDTCFESQTGSGRE